MLGLMIGETLRVAPASIADERSVRLTPCPSRSSPVGLSAEILSSTQRSVAEPLWGAARRGWRITRRRGAEGPPPPAEPLPSPGLTLSIGDSHSPGKAFRFATGCSARARGGGKERRQRVYELPARDTTRRERFAGVPAAQAEGGKDGCRMTPRPTIKAWWKAAG